jgi:hypothetical protein
MEGDHVRIRDDCVDRARPIHVGFQAPGTFHRDFRVVPDHLHAERTGGIRDLHADRAQSDHSERTTRKLEAHEALLAILDEFLKIRGVGVEAAQVLRRGDQVAGREQQAADHQFLDRVGIRARRIENGDTPFGQARDRDVVDPAAGTPDRHHGLRDRRRMQIVRAQHDRVGIGQAGGHLVPIPGESDRDPVLRCC